MSIVTAPSTESRFPQRLFRIACPWGVLVTLPLFFMLDTIGRRTPPPTTHPEFYDGFAGTVLAWQLAFGIIGTDPRRFRSLIPAAIVEKVAYTATVFSLYVQSRVPASHFFFGAVDCTPALLFTLAFVKTREPASR
jgi:cytochrome b